MGDFMSVVSDSVTVAKLGLEILDRMEKWNDSKISMQAKLGLLNLECRLNLNIIDSISIEKMKIDNEHIIDTFRVINKMETVVLEMVYLEASMFQEIVNKDLNNESYWEKIKNVFKADNDLLGGIDITLIQACSFVYLKISTLKKIAENEKFNVALKDIYLKSRIKNIKIMLRVIINRLSEIDPIIKAMTINLEDSKKVFSKK